MDDSELLPELPSAPLLPLPPLAPIGDTTGSIQEPKDAERRKDAAFDDSEEIPGDLFDDGDDESVPFDPSEMLEPDEPYDRFAPLDLKADSPHDEEALDLDRPEADPIPEPSADPEPGEAPVDPASAPAAILTKDCISCGRRLPVSVATCARCGADQSGLTAPADAPRRSARGPVLAGLAFVLILFGALALLQVLDRPPAPPEPSLSLNNGLIVHWTEYGKFELELPRYFSQIETLDTTVAGANGQYGLSGYRGVARDNTATAWYIFVDVRSEAEGAALLEDGDALVRAVMSGWGIAVRSVEPASRAGLPGRQYELADINARRGGAVLYSTPAGHVSAGYIASQNTNMSPAEGAIFLNRLSHRPFQDE